MAVHADKRPAPGANRAAPVRAAVPGRSPPVQLRGAGTVMDRAARSLADRSPPPSAPENRTGLPDALKAGVEAQSGLAMDDVRVHRNSPEPAKIGALAYAKGSDIHLGPGQEEHLPHEAWHVVQQKQGWVAATAQLKGMGINADAALEAEADRMGPRAATADRCRGRTLSRLAGNGDVIQPLLKSGTTWLTPAKGYSAVTLEYIGKPESFLMRDNSKPHHAVIHVLDITKKYLLGERHGSGKWEKDTANWNVDRMREGHKALPAEADDTAGQFVTKADPRNQPLESSHAYLLRVLLDAHDHLNLMSWVLRTFDEKQHKSWKLWADLTLPELDQLIVVYWNDYAPFIDTYEKKYLPSLFDPATKTQRPASPRLAKIYRFATDFRGYGPMLGALIKTVQEVRKRARRMRTPKLADHQRLTAAVDRDRTFVPVLAKSLIGIISEADPKEAAALDTFTAASDKFQGMNISQAVDPIRERAMAANIKKAAAPLLVQTGNDHVVHTPPNLVTLVGAEAVGVDMNTKFSEITEQS